MKMTLKEIDIYSATVERTKMVVEETLSQCSETVRADLAIRLREFSELWTTTKSLCEEGTRANYSDYWVICCIHCGSYLIWKSHFPIF